jgi:GGDEF domain-containing protein
VSDYHQQSRSRPVPDAPLAPLLARTEDLARRWAISLILTRPLERIGEIPLQDVALEAPDLCARVIGALASQSALEQLLDPDAGDSRTPVSRLGVLAGARDCAATVNAVEALRSVLWDALMDELRDPHPRQVADLADRLGAVCSALTTALLAPEQGLAEPASAGRDPEYPLEIPKRRVQEPQRPPQSANAASPWEYQPRIEIHDARREGPVAWIDSIGSQLERHARDGMPFAVLLIEVADMQRLEHVEDPEQQSSLISGVEDALRGGLRPTDLLSRESIGRYWLVTSETDAIGAETLAERLLDTVRTSVSHHGVGLELIVGIAVCPQDGHQAPELAAQADLKLYAARAAGLAIAPTDPHPSRSS